VVQGKLPFDRMPARRAPRRRPAGLLLGPPGVPRSRAGPGRPTLGYEQGPHSWPGRASRRALRGPA